MHRDTTTPDPSDGTTDADAEDAPDTASGGAPAQPDHHDDVA